MSDQDPKIVLKMSKKLRAELIDPKIKDLRAVYQLQGELVDQFLLGTVCQSKMPSCFAPEYQLFDRLKNVIMDTDVEMTINRSPNDGRLHLCMMLKLTQDGKVKTFRTDIWFDEAGQSKETHRFFAN